MKYLNAVKYVLLFIVVCLAALLIYSPHQWHPGPYMVPATGTLYQASLGDYPYPLHADGWNHLAQARFLSEEHTIRNIDPQRSTTITDVQRDLFFVFEHEHYSLQKGYHVLLTGLSYVTGLSLLTLAPFLPAILFFITALLVFLFFETIIKDSLAGLFAVVLLAFLPSTSYLLGFWFIVPLNTLLLFLCLSALHSYPFSQKNVLMNIFIVIISWFVYPLATLMVLLYLLSAFVFQHKKLVASWWKNPTARWLLVSGAFIVALFFFLFIDVFMFDASWAHTFMLLPLTSIIAWPIIMLGLLGILLLFWHEKSVAFFSAFVVVSSGLLVLLYTFFGFTVLLPYQRLLIIVSYILIFATAFLLGRLIDLLGSFLQKKRYVSKRDVVIIHYALALLVLVLISVLSFPTYYSPTPLGNAVHVNYDADKFALLSFVGNTTTPILADPFFSQTIYPLTGLKVLSVQGANLGGGLVDYTDFVGGDCEAKSKLLWESFAKYVISSEELDCTDLELVATSGSYRLYRTVWHDLLN
jgi:hypothetical protein